MKEEETNFERVGIVPYLQAGLYEVDKKERFISKGLHSVGEESQNFFRNEEVNL